METNVNYTIVGLFVVTLVTAIITITLWLTIGINNTKYTIYQVQMRESVDGLSIKAPVKLQGVEVGSVDKIDINPQNPREVILLLRILPGTPITVSTTAVITSQGLTGIAYIGLRMGSDLRPLKAKPGELYPVMQSSPSFLIRVDAALTTLTENLNSLTSDFKQLLNPENRRAINTTLTSLATLSQTLAANNKQLDQSMKGLAKASAELPSTLASLKKMSDRVATAGESVNKTLIQSNVAMQTFNNQLLPQTLSILQNLNRITSHLQGLSESVEQNPAVLLRGQKPKQPGPGE
ncbi:MlaD family protein [soil metagenome]